MTELFKRLVKKRGLSEHFLKPKYEECIDPFLLPDMEKAIKRIKKAKENKDKVLIYGDYDVDGVTASTLMFDVLSGVGIKDIEIMLPNRFSDGYGMSDKVLKEAKKKQINLVVTVDCGSRNHEIIKEFNELGIDAIVTDHHECDDILPEAVAVVNPKRKDCKNKDLKDLAGVGVAFKLAQAATKEKMMRNGQEKWLLDLVLIGTICDSMKMTEENRRLCYFGMKVLKKTRRVGLSELIKVCQAKRINSELIGFRIGPRLNASGRMATAERSLQLLMEKNSAEAARIARELNDLNGKRKAEQEKTVNDILKTKEDLEKKDVVVVRGKWHEGVIGIAAGKIVEELRKPAIVFAEKGEELKGSGRSYGDFNLVEALDYCKKIIISGGGHSEACGVKIMPDNFDAFDKKMNEFYRKKIVKKQSSNKNNSEEIDIEDLSELSLDFFEELNELEPFADGNEEPIFVLKNVLLINVRKMGKNNEHLGIQVRDKKGNVIKTVAFYAPEKWMDFQEGQRADVSIFVIENDFNGQKSVEGRIVKMRLVEEEIF